MRMIDRSWCGGSVRSGRCILLLVSLNGIALLKYSNEVIVGISVLVVLELSGSLMSYRISFFFLLSLKPQRVALHSDACF